MSGPTDSALNANYNNGESLDGQDNVMWYSEHFFHEPRDEEKPTMPYHKMGPMMEVRNFLPENCARPPGTSASTASGRAARRRPAGGS